MALTNYLGGKRYPEMAEKSDEELLCLTIADLKKIIGINSQPDFVNIVRHKKALPQYTLGHQDLLKIVEGLHESIPGLFVAGNYLRGISVRDCISNGAKLAGKIAKSLKSS